MGRNLLLAVVAAAIIAVAFLIVPRWVRYHASEARVEGTDDAQVAGELRTLSPQVGGYVARVLFDDYDVVQAGQPLIEIDQRPYRARLALSESRLKQQQDQVGVVSAQVAQQLAQADQAQAQIPSDEAQLRLAELQLARARQLAPTGAASQAALDQAQATADSRRADLARDRAAARAARVQVGVPQAQLHVARASVEEAKAQRDVDALNLDWTTVRAPTAGMLDRRSVFPGQLMQPGQAATNFVPLDAVWIQANFRETQLTRMQPGQHVRVRVDAFPDLELDGIVARVAPSTGSATAMLPSENATGNYTKVVQRVPVKIALLNGGGPLRGRLRPGMNAEVRVDTLSGPGPAPERRPLAPALSPASAR